MPKGAIDKYNKSRTQKERIESAVKAGKASGEARRRKKTIREIAACINATRPADEEVCRNLRAMGVKDGDITNGALIASAVFTAAISGDMKAVEKWERYVGQTDTSGDDEGQLSALILDLKRK